MTNNERAVIGGNGYLEPRVWRHEIAQSDTHAFIKLIIHTLELLVKDGEETANVSDEELSRLTSLSVKTVRKYRRDAEQEGWFSLRLGDGRGKITEYRLSVPQKTLAELASALGSLAKGYPEKDTLPVTLSQKDTLERLPSEGTLSEKVTPERIPFRDKGYPRKDTFSGKPVADQQIRLPTIPEFSDQYNIRASVIDSESEEGIQEEVQNEEPRAKKQARKKQLPEGWEPSEKTLAWATERICENAKLISIQLEAFRDSARANLRRYADWDLAFRNWLRNAKSWGHFKPQKDGHANGSKSFYEVETSKHTELMRLLES